MLDNPETIIVSYPNAGRTWLKQMTDMLDTGIMYSHQGSQHRNQLTASEIIQFLQQYPGRFVDSKIILLHRDIKDHLVSNYFQTIYRVGIKLALSEFLRHPSHGVEKLVRFNLFWKQFSGAKKIGTVKYDTMRLNPSEYLVQLIHFFDIPIDETRIPEVVDYCSFERMKDRETKREGWQYYYQYTTLDNPESFKCRRGKVGGYVDYLSPEDIQYCDSITEQYNYTGLMNDDTIGN